MNKTKWKKILNHAKAGNAAAQADAGLWYEEGFKTKSGNVIVKKNISFAVKWIKKSAAQNNLIGIETLARYYSEGLGLKKNIEKAIQLYKKSIKVNKSSLSCFNLALIFNGQRDYTAAFKYYKLACDFGDVDCYYDLGVHYFHGLGTKRNYSKAIECFRKVANSKAKNIYEVSRDDSNYYLGLCCLGGHGIKLDINKARKYLLKANRDGDNWAAKNLLWKIGEKK